MNSFQRKGRVSLCTGSYVFVGLTHYSIKNKNAKSKISLFRPYNYMPLSSRGTFFLF